ncbi:Imm52 family immunity protein [Paraburkholderia sediminicola]
MTDLLNVAGLCTCEVDSDGIASLFDPAVVVAALHDMTCIWPASSIQVGSYRYFARQQVFDDRPGAVRMLSLPREITHAQVPEARRLIPVMEGGHWKATIVVSVDDGAFRIDNAEHVASANAIERRLVDLDLLPQFSDL